MIDTGFISHTVYVDRLKSNVNEIGRAKEELPSALRSIVECLGDKDLRHLKVRNKFSLKAIPLTITIDDKIYKIAGVVAYKGKHYKSYVWQNQWFEYDVCATRKLLKNKISIKKDWIKLNCLHNKHKITINSKYN